jgi:TPR repeat protein
MSIRPVCPLLILAALLACAAPANAAGKRYALLVGVREYDHADLGELKYTENDVEELAVVLKDSGYAEVVVLTSSRGKKTAAYKPTARNIRTQLSRLSNLVTKHDLLLVALSGHGLQWPVLDTSTRKEKDESFFCPADARPRSQETLAELKKTMIPLGELFRKLDESGAGVRLMLVDACRNDARGSTRRNVDIDNLPRTKKGTAILFSCSSGQFAFETDRLGKGHGVFFYHVIQTMKSQPKLTWSRLADRVTDKVTEEVPRLIGGGAKQTPHEMRNIEGRSPLVLVKVAPAVNTGEVTAWYEKGNDFYYGRGVKQDYSEARKWYQRAADRDHAGAMHRLGLMYQFGQGVSNDDREAVRWYRKAADRGLPDGMSFLAGMYAMGRGVPRDDGAAVRWFRKAADKGHVEATFQLAMMAANGRGMAKDDREAIRWYRKAADRGHTVAMNALGCHYAGGHGVAKDGKEGVRWYRMAADRGLAVAMFNLAVMYQDGHGVNKDRAEVVRWVRQAAANGYAPAMTWLGFLYETGQDVGKDRAVALQWYRKAAALGHEDAKKAIRRLEPGR